MINRLTGSECLARLAALWRPWTNAVRPKSFCFEVPRFLLLLLSCVIQAEPELASRASRCFGTSMQPSTSGGPSETAPNTQKIPYSLRSGTPRPSPWPVFEPITRNKEGKIKWQRSLYRFGTDVDVKLDGRSLALSGRAGTIKLDLTKLDPSGLMAFKMIEIPEATTSSSGGQKRCMLALATPDKSLFGSFVSELDVSVRGVTVGYLVGITVKGVGYRIEPMEEKPSKNRWYFEDDLADRSAIAYPHPTPVPAVRLKVGYSRTAIFPLPPGIRAFCIKPTLLYLYGLHKREVDAVAAALRSVRRPNVYTGNGIQLVDEVVRIKQRKASK